MVLFSCMAQGNENGFAKADGLVARVFREIFLKVKLTLHIFDCSILLTVVSQ